MNSLLYGSTVTGQLGSITPASKLTPSGAQTPASASKVLRWKDMEIATAEGGGLVDEHEDDTGQSLFGTAEGCYDMLNGAELFDDEQVDIEELFV